MIISDIYKNDQNYLLKDVQHEEYFPSVGKIFKVARTQLTRADTLLETNLLIVKKAKELTTFDHRVLQDAHDILAAAYRYEHDDGGQLRLFEDEHIQQLRYIFGDVDTQRLRYLREWRLWLDAELEELCRYPKFIRSVVECVIFSNTEYGYTAENRLGDLLLVHFSAGDWMLEDGYLEVYRRAPA